LGKVQDVLAIPDRLLAQCHLEFKMRDDWSEEVLSIDEALLWTRNENKAFVVDKVGKL
jgi:hypothetical protein